MNSNESIEITQVSNGYLVRPAYREPGSFLLDDNMLVFQSFSELIGWIETHFSHRAEFLVGDAEQD
jgi:hypothetical protein